MLAALGMFVFETSSAPFEELARRRTWRHARTERFGERPAGQYLGPGDDEITLSGRLVPGLAGKYSALASLAEMAGTGEAYPLADGAGNILGQFTLDGLEESHKNLIDTGQARLIEFSITLTRVA